ncbi:MAG: hypothetical protein L0271_14130 [Gemmatimonadetes bacterium]|nr:hypothetical protein [Gemmatimonadota bacterium]
MITYWVDAVHRGGMDRYLANRGAPLAGCIEVRPYEPLQSRIEVTAGPHIFSALDQFGLHGRALVASLYDGLAQAHPGIRLLNDPRSVQGRGDLLETLHAAGINRFRARRVGEPVDELRFPVFVREEATHAGSLTGLLMDARALTRAVRALRARGYRPADLLIVEFCDLRDEEGLYHKAAAFRIGDAIVPDSLLIGRPWMLKWDDAVRDERRLRQNLEYVTGNPHQAWLRRVFDLARIDYGRCDYGIRGDTLQVWEINLNATITFGPGPRPAPLRPDLEAVLDQARAAHDAAMHAAFHALNTTGAERVTVHLEPALLARARGEAARARRRLGVRRFLQGVFHRPALGRPLRAAYHRFLPRL